jgi:hypothetical protein
MATPVLVDRDLEIGRRVLAALTRAGVSVSVAFWAYVPQIEEWQLFIATPLIDSEGYHAAYDRVLRALRSGGFNGDFPWRRIFLRSPKDNVLKSLEKASKASPKEAIRVVNEEIGGRFVEDAYIYGTAIVIESENTPRGNPSAYYVTYAPYSGSGEPTWIVTGLDHLRKLLSMLHISAEDAETALHDLSGKKRTSIPNVRLRAQDLRRLRPA